MFFDAFDVRRRSQQVFFLWTGDTKRTPNGKCQMLRRKQAKTMNKLCCPGEREFIQCAGYKLSGKGLPFFLGVSQCYGKFPSRRQMETPRAAFLLFSRTPESNGKNVGNKSGWDCSKSCIMHRPIWTRTAQPHSPLCFFLIKSHRIQHRLKG